MDTVQNNQSNFEKEELSVQNRVGKKHKCPLHNQHPFHQDTNPKNAKKGKHTRAAKSILGTDSAVK